MYVYLYSRVDDYANVEMSEERLRRTLPVIARYRKEFPQYAASALVQFSGAMSQVLNERNDRAGTVDLVKSFAQRGIIEIGYDGRDEPTYAMRPRPELGGKQTPEERWTARARAAERFLTEFKDLSTGVPDPSRSGGWKRAREVFGELVCASNVTPDLGGDSEFVHSLRRFNPQLMMFGLPEPDPARNIHGYRGSVQTFGWLMGPEPDSSPELYWQDNVLRSSETSDASVRVVQAHEGPDAMKKVLDALDRSRVRIIHVELAPQVIYLQPEYAKGHLYPPLRFAFDHPDRPRLPADAVRDRKEIDEAYSSEAALLTWLISDFFPNNPNSRFVSSADLNQMARNAAGSMVSRDKLKRAVGDLLARWGADTYPPSYVSVGREYFSLADMFQMLTIALAELHRKGRLPESVRLDHIYGPLEMSDDHGPNEGTVHVATVAGVAAELSDRLKVENWKPLPGHVVPSWVVLDGLRVNAAQFLRLMAQACLSPSPEKKLNITMCNMFSAAGEMFPRTIRRSDQGATWTFKPAPLLQSRRNGKEVGDREQD